MHLRTVAGIITEMDHIQLVFIHSNCGTYVQFFIIAFVVLIIVLALSEPGLPTWEQLPLNFFLA